MKYLQCLWLIFAFILSTKASAMEHKAEILNFETKVLVKGNKLVKNYTYAIKINNRGGDEYGQLSIPFSSMEKVSKISGFLEDRNGKVIKKIKKDDFSMHSSMMDISFYEDHFEYEITLKHYSYPYIIHYSYQEEQTEFLSLEYWSPVLDPEIPTQNATLEIIVAKDYKIRTWVRGTKEVEPTAYNNNYLRYLYRDHYTQLLKNEKNSPHVQNMFHKVTIIPNEFEYDIPGSYDTWQSFGNWKYQIKENLNELPESEKEKIDQLLVGVTDTIEIIKTLYHYLQDHTRYIYVGLETGGMKPFSATYVAEKKYGDCKALANYFDAMLAYVGISSFYCAIFAGSKILPVNISFPSSQFNHIISCIPLQKDTIWLDCTSKLAFNYLGSFTQNRRAFIIDNEGSRFSRTPKLNSRDVLETRKMDLYVDTLGYVNLNAEKTFNGPKYESLYYLNASYGEKDRDKQVRNYWIETGFAIQNYTIHNAPRDSTYIGLRYEAKSGTPYEKFGNEMLIKILPFNLVAYEKPEIRKLPVQINYPIYKIDTLQYNLPKKLALKSMPENVEINSEYGKYSLKILTKGENVQVIKSVCIYNGFIPKNKYEAFYNFVHQVFSIEQTSFLIANTERLR